MMNVHSLLPILVPFTIALGSPASAQYEWTQDYLPSGPRWQESAGAVAGKVFFAGGHDPVQGVQLDFVDIYDLFSRTWSVEHLSLPRVAPAVAAVCGRIFFAGGGGPHAHTDVVDIYDPITCSWSIDFLSQSRSWIAAAGVDDTAVFAGGWIAELGPSSTVDLYHCQSDTWSTAQLSQARYVPSAAATSRYALFAGGVRNGDGSLLSDVVDVYDSKTDTWFTLSLQGPTSGIMAASLGDLVFLAGGRTNQEKCFAVGATDRVEILDTSTMTWSQGPPLSEPRGYGVAVVIGQRIFFVGGWADGSRSTAIDIYDAETDQWSVETLPAGHSLESTAGVAIGNRAFFHTRMDGATCGNDTADWLDILSVYPEIGTPYCSANPNSTGLPGVQRVFGDTVVLHNQLRLRAEQLPLLQWGYFLMSSETGFVPNFGGSSGNLCLGPPIIRLIDPSGWGVLFTGSQGEVTLDLDLSNLPQLTQILPGETWHFQFWCRDVVITDFTSNTTNAVAITFE